MNEIVDISIGLSEKTITWPNDPIIKIKKISSIDQGYKANLSELVLSSHAGTHIDAPYHYVRNGKYIEDLKLEDLIGICYVKNVQGKLIEKKDLITVDLKKYKRILFRTNNSKKRLLFKERFSKDYVYLGKEAAEEIVKNKVKVVGIDYLSIEEFNGNGSLHKLLLGNNIIVLESLDLKKAEEGEYYLIALPLKIKKGDGAPSRIILQKLK